MRVVELVGGALEGRVRRAVGRALERRVGDAPVHELGMRRERRADLADAVAQGDHRVEALRANSSRCLVRFALMSMPRLAQHPDRVRDAAASGAAGAAQRRSSARHLLEQRLGDLRAGAVAGAQEQHPSTATGRRSADRAAPSARAERGMQRTARGLERLAAGDEVDRVVAVATVRRAAAGATPGRRRGAGAGGTTPGSAARRPAPSVPTRPDRCARAPAATASEADATPAARTVEDPPSSPRPTPPTRPRTYALPYQSIK